MHWGQPPSFDLPRDRRIPFAWPVLSLLLFLLAALALAGYFQDAGLGPNGKKVSLSRSVAEYEMALKRDALFDAMTETSLKSSATKRPATPFPKVLLGERQKNRTIARLYVVSEYEGGKSVLPADLAPLESSKDQDDRIFAEIYRQRSLSPARAKSLAASLPNAPFVFKLAKIDALEKAGVARPRTQVLSESAVMAATVAIGCYALAFFAGVILWAAYLLMRTSGRLVPMGHPMGEVSDGTSDRLAVRCSQFLLVFVVASIVAGLVAAKSSINVSVLELLMEALTVTAVLLLPLAPIGGRRVTLSMQGWHARDLGKNALWGVAGAVSLAPIIIGFGWLGQQMFHWLPEEQHPVFFQLAGSPSLLAVLGLLAVASVFAPIFEETVFRGTLLPGLQSRFRSRSWAVIVSSFLFAAFHPTGPPSWLVLGGIGATSCILIYQTRSIIPSVIMHALFNGSMLLIFLATS